MGNVISDLRPREELIKIVERANALVREIFREDNSRARMNFHYTRDRRNEVTAMLLPFNDSTPLHSSVLSREEFTRSYELLCLCDACRHRCPNVSEHEMDECCICMERSATCILPCAHAFCEQCVSEWTEVYERDTCPICRSKDIAGELWIMENPPNEHEVITDLLRYVFKEKDLSNVFSTSE